MRVPTLRPVLTYHARILVDRDGRRRVANVDRPDWSDDGEIVAELGRETGAHTVGEALVRAGAKFEDAGFRSVREAGKRVFGWGENCD